ncbi:MAG: DUF2179 domain-containing protein [Bacilli bacterium]|nr:DUF2179 domain-containing protein [Bacilli bacterium]MDD4608311.1 DUF2179 domain-containing protein [Bacilli bacterium]
MNIVLYIIIFASKVFENALGTLRLIVVANGKKELGAILQGVIALVWVIVTGVVVVGITEDPLKIIAFAVGSAAGSYLGSFIEQKMALGNNMLMAIVDKNYGELIATEIRNNGFAVTVLDGNGMDKERNILMVVVTRKKRHNVVDIVKNIDQEAMIVSENTFTLYGGYQK